MATESAGPPVRPFSTVPVVLLAVFVVVGAGRAVGVLANTYSTVELRERGVLRVGSPRR